MRIRRIPLPLRLAALYAIFGGLWILLSDRILDFLVHDQELLTQIQTYKGWGFVAASALLIYILLHSDPYLRQRAESALHESEARFSTVFQASPIGLSITHIRDGRLVDVNDEFLTLLGFARDEVIGRTTLELKIWINPGEREKMISILMGQGWVKDYETQFRRKSGELRNVLLSTTLIDLSGERYILNLIRDITESKRTEEKIDRQYQHLASLSAIDTVITSSFDLDLTLSVFLERVLSQLDVDAAMVLLLRPGLNLLEYAAGRGFRGNGATRLSLRLGEGYAGRAALERRLVGVPDISQADHPALSGDVIREEGFIAFYSIPLIAKGEIKGVLEVMHRTILVPDNDWIEFFTALGRQAAIAIDNAGLFSNLQRSNEDLIIAYDQTIEGWSRALDLRDKETEGHTQRVTELTMRLARRLEIADRDLVHIRRGALLHDIGKMGVPDAILLKPSGLTEEETAVMRKHPVYAYELLHPIEYLHPALDIPHYHHEKWDGSGFPDGLKGEQIPLAARLFAVVDAWDALHSDRPYRAGWSSGKIREHLQTEAGSHFDPRMVQAFLEMMKEEG